MRIFSILRKSNVLYFPGCLNYFKHKDIFDLYQRIFKRLDIEFKLIDKKICCGLPCLELGYNQEARKLARRNFEIFKEEEINSIITNSPCCYRMFLNDYPKLLPNWNIEVRNVWKIILTKLQEKPSLIRKKSESFEIIAYQDSCYLGRYCDIYEEPRAILKLIGYELKEIPDSKFESICCGGCGGLPLTNPKLANSIAKERLMQAKRFGINKIVVASLTDYEILKANSEGMNIKIFELGEILGFALGLLKKNKDEDMPFIESSELDDEEIIVPSEKIGLEIQEETKEDYDDKIRG